MFYHGVIVTNATLPQIRDCVRLGGYNTVKVVTGWGLPSGWTDNTRREALSCTKHAIVRTVAGDPSYGGNVAHSHTYLYPDKVLSEIAPWLEINPELWIELGNEPNVIDDGKNDAPIWVYRWFLNETIQKIRHYWPKARIVSPAPIMEAHRRPSRWFEIMADVIRSCDAVGFHAYEHLSFTRTAPPVTNDLALCQRIGMRLFSNQPWFMTEYGINDPQTPDARKGEMYAALWQTNRANYIGATYYHLDTSANPLQPQYVIYPNGDTSYNEVFVGKRKRTT